MKNILAIAILMVGLAGVALAQDYSNSSDAPPMAHTPTVNIEQQKESPPKPDCKADQQPGSTQQDPCLDCDKVQETQAPDQAPQNVIEYGG